MRYIAELIRASALGLAGAAKAQVAEPNAGFHTV